MFFSSHHKIVQNEVQKRDFISNTKYIKVLLLVITVPFIFLGPLQMKPHNYDDNEDGVGDSGSNND